MFNILCSISGDAEAFFDPNSAMKEEIKQKIKKVCEHYEANTTLRVELCPGSMEGSMGQALIPFQITLKFLLAVAGRPRPTWY